MATGANATPLGKLHPSIGAKRGFDAGPGAGNGLMPTPGQPAAFPSLQGFQPPMSNASFPPAHQFNPVTGFSTQAQQQQSVVGGMGKSGKLSERPLTLPKLLHELTVSS